MATMTRPTGAPPRCDAGLVAGDWLAATPDPDVGAAAVSPAGATVGGATDVGVAPVIVVAALALPAAAAVTAAAGLVNVEVVGGAVPDPPPDEPLDAEPDAGTKVPSRCQSPVKLLNGPPWIWLAHVTVKAPVEAL